VLGASHHVTCPNPRTKVQQSLSLTVSDVYRESTEELFRTILCATKVGPGVQEPLHTPWSPITNLWEARNCHRRPWRTSGGPQTLKSVFPMHVGAMWSPPQRPQVTARALSQGWAGPQPPRGRIDRAPPQGPCTVHISTYVLSIGRESNYPRYSWGESPFKAIK